MVVSLLLALTCNNRPRSVLSHFEAEAEHGWQLTLYSRARARSLKAKVHDNCILACVHVTMILTTGHVLVLSVVR